MTRLAAEKGRMYEKIDGIDFMLSAGALVCGLFVATGRFVRIRRAFRYAEPRGPGLGTGKAGFVAA